MKHLLFLGTKPFRRTLLIGAFLIIIFILLTRLPYDMNNNTNNLGLNPSSQLQRFGIVSEEGVLELDKVEKVDKEKLALEKSMREKEKKRKERAKIREERRKKLKNSQQGAGDDKDERAIARNKRRLDRQRKAKERKRKLLAKNKGNNDGTSDDLIDPKKLIDKSIVGISEVEGDK